MLSSKLIHPEILGILATAGHGSKVLIADGNYPFATTGGPNTEIVYLNLAPDVITCTQALEALLSVQPIEAAAVMDVPPSYEEEPPIWNEFREIISKAGYELTFDKIERFKFYETIAQESTALVIATGDKRLYANLLLTLGCA